MNESERESLEPRVQYTLEVLKKANIADISEQAVREFCSDQMGMKDPDYITISSAIVKDSDPAKESGK